MSNKTTGATLVTPVQNVTSAGNITSVLNATTPTIPTTVEETTSISPSSPSPTTQLTVTSTGHTDGTPSSPITPSGSSTGAIIGGVVGGVAFVAIVIILVLLLLYRHRRRQKKLNKPKPPLAPGKDDISKIENKRRKNDYAPEPYTGNKQEGIDLYTNVTNDGQTKESTDPALDPQGYLKAQTKTQREAGNELYYETSLTNNKQTHYTKVEQDEFYVNDEVQPGNVNKKVHGKHRKKKKTGNKHTNDKQREKEYLNSTVTTEGEHKLGSGKASSMDNHNLPKFDTSRQNKKEIKTGAVNDNTGKDEQDEDYEIPDPASCPEPKKTSPRTPVKDKKHHNVRKSPRKDKSPKGKRTKTSKGNDEGTPMRESKYMNVPNVGYVNVGNENNAVAEEYYEVPDNK